MKVLVIGRCMPEPNSSYGKFEFEQALALSQTGIDVVYAYSDNRSIKFRRKIGFSQTILEGVECIGISFPSGGLPSALFDKIKTYSLTYIMNRLNKSGWMPEVVYAHFPLLTLTSTFISALVYRKIPLVCMEHWTKVLLGKLSTREASLLTQCVSKSAYFCCVSNDLKLAVRKAAGIRGTEIPVIPNYIEVASFTEPESDKTGSEVLQFVSAGRLEPVKHFDLLIESFARCAERLNIKLLIAGDGTLKRQLQNKISQSGADDRIVLLGWKTSEQMLQLLHESNIYISASSLETFGVPIVESWLMGLPCVAPDNNALRAYFSPENGLMIKVNDVSSLENAIAEITRLYRNNAFDSKIITAAAENSFSKQKVLNQIIYYLKEASYAYAPEKH